MTEAEVFPHRQLKNTLLSRYHSAANTNYNVSQYSLEVPEEYPHIHVKYK